MNEIIREVSFKTNLNEKQISKVLELLAEGSTVPFIARYRKEVTGSLDEEQIRSIEKVYKYENNLTERKEEVIRLIDEKGMLNDNLKKQILSSGKLQEVEDLYLPFKEKKKTKATEAIKQGLEPFANKIKNNEINESNYESEAKLFINDEVTDVKSVLNGAMYIIAEEISDKAKYRKFIRNFTYNEGMVVSKIKKNGLELDEKNKYEIYYDFTQKVKQIPSYRILAFNRGEKEKILNVKINIENEKCLTYIIENEEIDSNNKWLKNLYNEIVLDSFKRLIYPSIEREIRKSITESAEEYAINVFASNLDELIMQPPLKGKVILGVDPAFRTGCKLAVIDNNSKVKKIDVIYPHPKEKEKNKEKELHLKAAKKINEIVNKYKVEYIALGNGTASRETERFLKENIDNVPVVIISESGASVYSASKIAKDEFPDLEVEQRSAVSIARRMQDPMAELVKIEPKSIGVGQYQHDVNQKKLSENLDFIMIKNINKIGVDINTASKELLQYVSGLDKSTAQNIIKYREENGSFVNRNQLLKVKRLGTKAFEQSAGFLKIYNGDEQFDEMFIHPEKYDLAEDILQLLEVDKNDIGKEHISNYINGIDPQKVADELEVDGIVVSDILDNIASPMQDERGELIITEFDPTVKTINDLSEGMKIKGQVRNILQFGAFVDIGIKNDGLVHISEISNRYVKDVSDFLNVGEIHDFKVKSIDEKKGQVQLTLKD